MVLVKLLIRVLNPVILLFILAGVAFTSTASAQISIEIGISRDKAVRKMVQQGYTQIKILRKGFKTIEATACQNRTRFKVKINDKYRLKNTTNLGPCRKSVTAQSIEQNLINSGFTRVVIDRQNGNFVALACRKENRVRINYSQQGEVLQRRKIGRCEEIFQPNDVRQVLRNAGYDRIRFLDRQLPWYRAEACRDGLKLELLLTRFGEVRRSTRIGDCAPLLEPRRLEAFLTEKGYNRINVIDDTPPNYRVGACFRNDRVDLDLNRYGQITSRKVIGECRKQLDERQIVDLLRQEGFQRISVTRRDNGEYAISACFEGYQKFATLSRFGELLTERDGNRCKPRNVSEIYDRLQERGFRNTTLFSESCRRGRKVRIYYDQYGDETRRERVGGC